jgi:ParB-like chromosome segregation protein Spo0J
MCARNCSDLGADVSLPVHPLLALYPMTDGDVERLTADIAAHGQREPILVSDGTIIAGRLRLEACQQLRLRPETKEVGPLDAYQQDALVIASNSLRRHLSTSQRAMLAARMESYVKDALVERWANLPNVPKGKRPRQIVAHWHGVSERSVQDAIYVLARSEPLVEAVLADRKSLASAVRELKHHRSSRPAVRRPSRAEELSVAPLEDQLQDHIDAIEFLLNSGDDLAAIAPERRREFGQRLTEAAQRIDPTGAPEPVDFAQARQRLEMIRLVDDEPPTIEP